MKKNIEYLKYQSPIGELIIAGTDKKISVITTKKCKAILDQYQLTKSTNNKVLNLAKTQLTEYFNGERKHFNLPIDLSNGTSFQQKSWKTLMKIPYGKTIAYKNQATKMGNSKLSRAVGSANGKNPLLIVIPCHRVIASDGSLGGFSAGLSLKRYLLKHETVQ